MLLRLIEYCIQLQKLLYYFKDNISYKKVATQSPTYVALNAESSFAVDGIISTCMKTLDIGRTSLYKTVWWKVDLGEVYSIYSINILFKNYDNHGIYMFAERLRK